jgi:hypothetical protein
VPELWTSVFVPLTRENILRLGMLRKWGRPPACGGLPGRPALDYAYSSGLVGRYAVTGLFAMYRCMRRNSSPLRPRWSKLSSCQKGRPAALSEPRKLRHAHMTSKQEMDVIRHDHPRMHLVMAEFGAVFDRSKDHLGNGRLSEEGGTTRRMAGSQMRGRKRRRGGRLSCSRKVTNRG